MNEFLIKALSRLQFNDIMNENNISDKNVEEFPIYIISINNPDEPDSHYFKENHNNVLTLYFHDCIEGSNTKIFKGYDNNSKPIYDSIIFFNEQMAKEVLKKLNEIKEKNTKGLIIHCSAGISRSGAIATFARDFLNKPTWEKFKRDNPNIHPNSTVIKRLKEKSYDK